MPKPACLKCRRFYRVKRNGVAVVEGMPQVNGALPGDEDDASWKDYKLWQADLFECMGCGHQIIAGWARESIAEHYQPTYASTKEQLAPIVRINDC